MNFDFGHAAELYRKNVHPRVYVGPGDLDRLRALARAGDGKKIMQGMRGKVRPFAERILAAPAGEPLDKEITVWLQWNMHDLAMTAVLDRDEQMLDAAKKALLAAFARPSGKRNGPDRVFTICRGLHPLAYDLLHDRLTADEVSRYCSAMVEECVRPAIARARPHYFRDGGENTPLVLTLPCILGLLAIQGDAGAGDVSAELAELVRFLEVSLFTAMNPDGYPEEDTGYGTMIAAHLGHYSEPLRRAGVYDPYAKCPHYAGLGNAVLHIVQPWGEHLTTTGDHGDDFGAREFILSRQAKTLRKPELLWLLGTLSYGRPPHCVEVILRKGMAVPATALSLMAADQFKTAAHPKARRVPTAFRDHGRGFVSFRSSWNDDATYFTIDASQRSPAGQGHFHDSAGHFTLSAAGEYFAVGRGRYNLDQTCHNVTLVNGKTGHTTNGQWSSLDRRHGRLIDYKPGGFVDFAGVDSTPQHNCFWAWRWAGLVKGAHAPAYAWTVDDINEANDWAEFWWQLHTSPENVITLGKSSASIRGWRGGGSLDVHFALPDPASYPKPHKIELAQDQAVMSSNNYIGNPQERAAGFARPSDQLHYSVFVGPRLLAKVSGYNGRFMSLMIPRARGEKAAKAARLPSLDNSLAMRITFAAVEDTMIWAYEHHLLEAGDVRGRGRWCVVRRNRKTGKVLDYAIDQGVCLNVAGKELKV